MVSLPYPFVNVLMRFRPCEERKTGELWFIREERFVTFAWARNEERVLTSVLGKLLETKNQERGKNNEKEAKNKK